jgi:alpha-glucosidase
VGDSQRGLEILGEYTRGDDLMQMCYAFEFLAADIPTAPRIVEVMDEVDRVATDGWTCWAFSNHDVVRHATRWALAPGAQRMFTTLIMCLRGSVCIYQGEELGLPEADVSFDDLQDPYGIEFWPEFKGRDGCRTPMVWTPDSQNGGFSDVKPWLPVASEHLALAVAAQEDEPGALVHHYRKAIALRHANPALSRGSLDKIRANGDVVYFTRREGDQVIFCAFNVSDTPSDFDMPDGNWTPIGGELGAAHVSADGRLHLGPWQVCLALKTES